MDVFLHPNDKSVNYMRRALELAKRGSFATFSNPLVGCVLVKDDLVIGEGWHAGDGTLHAEAMALANAKKHFPNAIKGAVAYVTLEPCCYTNKQPPCTDSLISCRISKVVVACKDPNPLVDGKGLAQLKDAGIVVETGLLSKDAEALNKGFFHRHKTAMPWLIAKLAVSLDGRIAAKDGSSEYISSAASRIDAMRMRARSQAILTTSNTLIVDNPQLNVRDIEDSDIEATSGITQPQVWIVDYQSRVAPNNRVFALKSDTSDFNKLGKNQPRKVVWLRAGLERLQTNLPSQIEIIDTSKIKVTLTYLLQQMAARGINQVLTECGGKMAGSLLQAKLINELVIYQAPILLGNLGIPMAELDIRSINQATKLKLVASQAIGEDMKYTYMPIY